LTGKTRAKHVERTDCGDVDPANVAVRSIFEVCFVCLLRKLIPIAREDALSARSLKCDSKTADPAEEVNETKFGAS
jgi:hypothetical protein